jgi:hypothetical protein
MSFLSRQCARNQVSWVSGTATCFSCPDIERGNLATVQQKANDEHPNAPNGTYPSDEKWARLTDPLHAGKAYCGKDPIVKKWTLYAKCHGETGRHAGFVNPFQYDRLGTSYECFESGKNIGSFLGSANRGGRRPAARRGGRGGGRVRGLVVAPVVEEEKDGESEEEEKAPVPLRRSNRRRS